MFLDGLVLCSLDAETQEEWEDIFPPSKKFDYGLHLSAGRSLDFFATVLDLGDKNSSSFGEAPCFFCFFFWLSLNFGDKNFSVFGEAFFFLVFTYFRGLFLLFLVVTWFGSREKNGGRALFNLENWAKLG